MPKGRQMEVDIAPAPTGPSISHGLVLEDFSIAYREVFLTYRGNSEITADADLRSFIATHASSYVAWENAA